jgi:uncharacterized protein
MAVNLYDFTVPIFIRVLTNLDACLKKGEEWAKEKGISADELCEARLIEDMRPLAFQIQVASNTAKNTVVRVAGTTAVPMEDDETTMAQLHERIQKTLDVLKDVKREEFEGKHDVTVHIKNARVERDVTGLQYLQGFALANFFFHVSTAYGILRAKGVPLGKFDYLGV